MKKNISKKPHLILASASPRRRDLLSQVGIFADRIIPAEIDETPKAKELPRIYAKRVAQEKALAIAKENPEAWVLAADTVVACGRRILPKAENAEDAYQCMKMLSGRTHRVYGAICLVLPKQKPILRLAETRVAFRHLTEGEIKAYIAAKEWEGKAGGYAVQGLAAAYISKLVGSYSNVVGLSLFETCAMLGGKGYPLPSASVMEG